MTGTSSFSWVFLLGRLDASTLPQVQLAVARTLIGRTLVVSDRYRALAMRGAAERVACRGPVIEGGRVRNDLCRTVGVCSIRAH